MSLVYRNSIFYSLELAQMATLALFSQVGIDFNRCILRWVDAYIDSDVRQSI